MFDALKTRLRRLVSAPAEIAFRAAPLIERKLRDDATTRRGNVPSYGRMGDVPIAVDVRGTSLEVKGPDWVLEKAREKGQVEEWAEIERETARRVLGGG